MARTPEQKAWDDLGPQLRSLTQCVDRIESVMTGTGIPDVAYSWKNGHGWIELKADDKCESIEDVVDLKHYTKVQRAWMRRRSAHGKNCWLMIRTGHGWYAVPGIFAFALPDRPTHKQLLDHKAHYLPDRSASFKWLRQFL